MVKKAFIVSWSCQSSSLLLLEVCKSHYKKENIGIGRSKQRRDALIWIHFRQTEFLNIYIFYCYKAICWDIFGFNKYYILHYLLELLVQNNVSPNLWDTFTRLPWWTYFTINNISDQRTEHYFEVYDQTMEDLR